MSPLSIVAMGAFTPVGTSTATTMAALFNNVQLFSAWTGLGPGGAEATVAATSLRRKVGGKTRLVTLARTALQEITSHPLTSSSVPVVLCGPPADESGVEARDLLPPIASGLIEHDPKRSRVLTGRSGVADGLRLAGTMVEEERAEACVLIAVDSLLLGHRLLALKRQQRLFDPEENPGGMIPGEGAVALLLAGPKSATRLALLSGLGSGQEPPEPSMSGLVTGRAMSAAIQAAMTDAGLGGTVPACLALDATSPELGQELGFAKSRAPLERASALPLHYPSICVGEAGVVTPTLTVAMLAFFLSKNAVAGPALAVITDQSPVRHAVALTSAHPGRDVRSG